ncbi:MAG: OsmC family protein [Chitinivibrionales bacterium]
MLHEGAPVFTKAEAELKISSDESEKKVERVFEKTLDTCPVAKLLRQAGIDIEYTLTMIE